MGLSFLVGCTANEPTSNSSKNIAYTPINQVTDKADDEIPSEVINKNLDEDVKIPLQNPDPKKDIEQAKLMPPIDAPITSKPKNQQSASKKVTTASQYPTKDKQPALEEKVSLSQEADNAIPKESAVKEPEKVISNKAILYKDGVYTGSSIGKEGPIEVQVEIVSSKIQSIEVLSHQDTKNLAQNVFRLMTEEMLSAQSSEINIISGATLTSAAYKEAVKNALNSASIN